MHRRYEHANIPIEVIRSFVCVVANGSFSKAGSVLGLSQPAITAQIKRLQTIAGGPIFDRAKGGSALTQRGVLVLTHARKLLQENDQILSLGGATSDSQPIRVGVPTIYAEEFLKVLAPSGWHDQLTLLCAHSIELEKNFTDGYLDVACFFHRTENFGDWDHEWSEEFVWVRSPTFVLSPGSPIPIVAWRGSLQDQPALQALEANGLAYRIVFRSYDWSARMAAVAAGIGLMSLPARRIRAPIIAAKDYYLPHLPPVRVGIHVRKELAAAKAKKIVDLLKTLQQPRPAERDQTNGSGMLADQRQAG